MFARRLQALGYPKATDFKTDFRSVRELVVWLEDNKLRFLPIESRSSLKADDFKEFKRALNSYLNDIGCPYGMKEIESVLAWLLGRAIRSEYAEVLQDFPQLRTSNEFQGARAAARLSQKEKESALAYKLPLPSPDLPEFKRLVTQLCDYLHIPEHEDHILRIQAAAHLITERDNAKDSRVTDKSRKSIGLTPSDLGFNLGDAALDEAAMGLRLLHQSELRSLQTKINEIIVSAQSITADPKTDERLGRVGK